MRRILSRPRLRQERTGTVVRVRRDLCDIKAHEPLILVDVELHDGQGMRHLAMHADQVEKLGVDWGAEISWRTFLSSVLNYLFDPILDLTDKDSHR